MEIALPNPDRTITTYTLTGTPIPFEKHNAADFPRIACAAAHVVAVRDVDAELDVEATPVR